MTDQAVDKLREFVSVHNEYNKGRSHTFTEEQVLQSNKKFFETNTHVSLKRNEKANYNTFCAHGTNAFVLFLAFAFATAQLLPGNTRKLTGVPRITGESQGKSRVNSNFVSAVTLLDNDSALFSSYKFDSSYPAFYANKSVLLPPEVSYDELCDAGKREYKRVVDTMYSKLQRQFSKKYTKRNKNQELQDKIGKIFQDESMREVCIKLFNTSVIILGDGIGKCEGKKLDQAEMGFERKEVLYEKINIRCIIVDKDVLIPLKNLINMVNPEIGESVAWFNNQEIQDFEEERKNNAKNSGAKVPEDSFLNTFIERFGGKLPFEISKKFGSTTIEKDLLYSYSSTGKRDNNRLTILKKEDQLKVYKESVEYSTQEENTTGSSKESNSCLEQINTEVINNISEQPTASDTTTQPVVSIPPQQKQPVDGGPQTATSSAAPLQQTPFSNGNNNNPYTKQNTQTLFVVDNKIHDSLQKQSSGISSREWTMGLALLFGTVGATLVAIGIIPEITAIGIIATAVLLGIASAALGGVVGYLIDITVNNFHSEATMKVA
ncbi:putative membrane protein [Wolbachia endosymbiont of Culex quinquefasciatus JHB]|nr:putative membrane protein [Wolbachia endosymbiont of Culex quinquefasciatus JHB]